MSIIWPDLRPFDRRAVLATLPLVRRVRAADLSRPTPCAGWTLTDLLAHCTAQHRGFLAAAQGRGDDLALWQPVLDEADPAGAYEEAALAVLAGFAADGVLDREFALPEIGAEVRIPARQAIGFHFIDYVVHGWDVARGLGEPFGLDDDLAPAALRIAAAVPDGPNRLVSGASFAPGLKGQDDDAPLREILRLLGRSPDWAPDSVADVAAGWAPGGPVG